MARGRPWTADEHVLAFALYCRTPFGRLHRSNQEVIALARALGRTPSSVAMRCVNYANLDPSHSRRGVRGLSNVSGLDRKTFDRFRSDMGALEREAVAAALRLGCEAPRWGDTATSDEERGAPAEVGQTEAERTVMVRRVQGAFRRAVVASYDERCAICAITLPELLTASHVIPWAEDESRRADPTNGIAMCALHDRAFDRLLMTILPNLLVRVSPRVRVREPSPVHAVALLDIDGAPINKPTRFSPDPSALAHHNARFEAALADCSPD